MRIAVAGMHRSGTSLVARALQLTGVSLGPTEDLMPSKDDNPTGFWENLNVVQINDDLMAQLGGSWFDPVPLEDDWKQRDDLGPYRERIRDLVATDFSGPGPVAWKDPRISLLLPIWVAEAAVDRVVLVLRDPRAVARSVAGRRGLDEDQAAHLWTRYTSALIRAWPDPVLAEYEDFLRDPAEALTSLCERLGLSPPSQTAITEVRTFADASLSHFQPTGVPETPVMLQALRLMTLLRHSSDLAVAEADINHALWLGSRDDQDEAMVLLQREISILRERLVLKDEHLFALERTIDRMGAQPQPVVAGQSDNLLRTLCRRVTALRGGG